MIVAVDFDNTLIDTIDYPSINYKLLPNAREVITYLHDVKNVEFRINTSRTGWFRLPVIWFIWKEKLPIKTYLFNKKVRADIYVDDSNLYCEKIDWLEIQTEILHQLEIGRKSKDTMLKKRDKNATK